MGYAELIEKLETVPDGKRAEVFDFVDYLAARYSNRSRSRRQCLGWQRLEQHGSGIQRSPARSAVHPVPRPHHRGLLRSGQTGAHAVDRAGRGSINCHSPGSTTYARCWSGRTAASPWIAPWSLPAGNSRGWRAPAVRIAADRSSQHGAVSLGPAALRRTASDSPFPWQCGLSVATSVRSNRAGSFPDC